MKATFSCALLLASMVVMASCAITPNSAKWQARSDSLFAAQVARLPEAGVARGGESRRFYVGMAMHSASHAFQGDVVDVSALLRRINPAMSSMIFSNHPVDSDIDYPFATRENFSRAMDVLARQASPRNLVVILLSSHGDRDVLSVNIAQEHFPLLSGDELKLQLSKLQRMPTVLIISSCYSGTLIPALRASNRIIITAASNRPSFGCETDSKNTYFVDEFFKHNFSAELSLNSLFKQAHEQVRKREAIKKLPFSDPQIFIGSEMRAAADQPFRILLERGAALQPPASQQSGVVANPS